MLGLGVDITKALPKGIKGYFALRVGTDACVPRCTISGLLSARARLDSSILESLALLPAREAVDCLTTSLDDRRFLRKLWEKLERCKDSQRKERVPEGLTGVMESWSGDVMVAVEEQE
jgi:hypothetical protein